VIKGLEAE